MSQHVRLFSGHVHARGHTRADGAAGHAAAARVHLKLAALAWANVCLGVSMPPSVTMAAVASLCRAAAAYYGALIGRSFDPEDDTLRFGDLPPPGASPAEVRVVMARAEFLLGAVGYVSSRHGADACIEFTRAAIGGLCNAAIGYCEALVGVPTGETKVVDRTMHLDDGS